MPGQLLIVSGPDKGRFLPLTDGRSLLLGTSKALDSRLTDPQVARVHAEIETDGGVVRIVDCGAPAGTLVNGNKVATAELKSGDVIRIGETELRFQPESAGSPVAPVPPKAPEAKKGAGKLDELLGQTISHYELRQPLAAGRFGRVFYSWDTKHDRPAAVKVLYPDANSEAIDSKRFIRAMKTVLPIRHPNIISLYGAGKTGPYLWCAMEYIDGQNLAEVIKKCGEKGITLPWEYAFRTAIQVARGLEEADRNRVVHRNLTPSNIMVSSVDHTTKLCDLMFAKALEGPLATNLTKTNQTVGESLEYTPPERVTGASPVDERSDVYGLGAILYALLTGRPPVTAGRTAMETIERMLKIDPERPKKFQPGLPELFDKMVMKMIARDPGDRFGSASALLDELTRIAKLHGGNLEKFETRRFEEIDALPRDRMLSRAAGRG